MRTELYTNVPLDIFIELIALGPKILIQDGLNRKEIDTSIPLVAVLESGEIFTCSGYSEHKRAIEFSKRNFILPDEYKETRLVEKVIHFINSDMQYFVVDFCTESWVDERTLTWKKENKDFLHHFDPEDFINLRAGEKIQRKEQILREQHLFKLISDRYKKRTWIQDFVTGIEEAMKYVTPETIKSFFEEAQVENMEIGSGRKPTLDQQEGNPDAY